MAFQFHLPDIGEGVVEGEIVAWKVKVGDKVKMDQPIVEIMTDKATVEIPSPRAGTIAKINYQDGEICPVGQVLLEIEEDGVPARPAASVRAATPSGHATEPTTPRAKGTTQQALHVQVAAGITHLDPIARGIEVVDASASRARVLATPATRRLARQLGVEIGRVTPTGKHGRVTTDDVTRHQKGSNGGSASITSSASGSAAQAKSFTPIASAKLGEEERIPLRGVRRKIAESMARSVHTAAHFTYVEEIDMTELVTVREHAKARAAERGIKLNYLPFIVKAVVAGLKKWPSLNASLDETTQEIVRKKYYHIGIAAQGPHGLAVSVVRDADRRSIVDLS